MKTVNKSYLNIAGFTLILVGAYIGLTPADYLAKFSLSANGPDLLSELRGLGGCLLVFGCFMVKTAFAPNQHAIGLTVSKLVFAAFSSFRVIGIVVEGLPSTGILIALAIEIVLAAAAFVLHQQHNK